MSKLQILNKIISNTTPAFIIAEVGQAHDGSLGMAHSFIDAASEAGVDAIKFQTHIASAESTYNDTFRVKFSMQDDSRFEYWRRMEFTEDQWVGLAKHAADKNLVFLSSPFSIEAIDLLEKIGNAYGNTSSNKVVDVSMNARGQIEIKDLFNDCSVISRTKWITSLSSVNQSFGLPRCVRFSKDVLFEAQGKVKRLQRNPGLPHCVR